MSRFTFLTLIQLSYISLRRFYHIFALKMFSKWSVADASGCEEGIQMPEKNVAYGY